MTYMIIRTHANNNFDPVVLERGLTLEEAQAHCKDKETSSRTCSSSEGIEYTATHGSWFDAYEQE